MDTPEPIFWKHALWDHNAEAVWKIWKVETLLASCTVFMEMNTVVSQILINNRYQNAQ